MNQHRCIAAAGLLALTTCQTAQVADVLTNAQICNYLTMYANGIASASPNNRCTQLGQPTQTLWVCELPNPPANFDVHTTFNQGTPLHLTVTQLAPLPCSGRNAGRTNLNGTWPALTLASPNPLCGQNPAPFLAAINQIPNVHTARAGFIQAQNLSHLTPAQTTGWLRLVTQFC